MAADVAEIVLQNEDSASPMTVTKPASFASGQILIEIIVQDGGLLSALTAPSGWTTVPADVDITGQRGKAFYHVFDGAEPATWDFPYDGGSSVCGALFRITGADTTPVLVAATNNSASNGSTMDSPSVTPSGSNDLLIVAMSNSGGSAAFSATDPSGTTDLGQTQFSNLFQGLMAAKELLASGAPTGVRTWTSISPTGRQAGTWSIAVKSSAGAAAEPAAALYPNLPPPLLYQLIGAQLQSLSDVPPEPLTDPWQAPFPPDLLVELAAWQLRIYGGEEAAAAGIPQTAAGTLGLSGTGTAVRHAAVTGSTSLGFSGTGTARKTAAETGTAALGLAGTGTEKKTAPDTGRAAIGLSGTGAEKKTAPDTGLATVGFSGQGTGSQNIPRPETGAATIGLSGRGTEVKRAAQTGVAAVGLSGRGTERKTAPSTGRSVLALAGTGAPRKMTAQTGRVALAVVGQGSALQGTPPPPGSVGLDGDLRGVGYLDRPITSGGHDHDMTSGGVDSATSSGVVDGGVVVTGQVS